MSWAAIGSAVVGSVVSVGLSAAVAPGAPGSPDLAAASREGVENAARLLPDQRRLEMAAQLGTSTTFNTSPRQVTETVQMVNAPRQLGNGRTVPGAGELVPYVAADWEQGGKYYNAQMPGYKPRIISQRVTRNVAGTRTADFTGYGTADVQGRLAKQMADIQLEMSKKYGVQFAEEARKQLQESDPEGFAAREELYKELQDSVNAKPERPVAELLDKQVADQVKAGGGLTDEEDARLRAAVLRAGAARGQGTDGVDFTSNITDGSSGEARRQEAIRKGMAWLSSGQTPEDIDYRREQQNLANLASFVQGRTPESQFSNLRGGQQGAAPTFEGAPLPGMNPNAGQQAQNFALTGYQQRVQNALGQANPWMAGLSGLISGANTLAAAKK